jgi:type IV pilus assembly protein PilF
MRHIRQFILPASRATKQIMAVAVIALAACAAPDGSSPSSGRQQPSEQAPSRGQGEVADRMESARLRTELGFNYFLRGQMAVALEEVRSAIESNRNYAPAYNVLGLIHMDLGENPKADEAFKRALALVPGDSDTLNNYGWFLCQTKRERESIALFLQALKNPLYPTPYKPYLNAGICSQRAGDEAAAESYYRRAFELDPGNPSTMLRLGELYLKKAEYEKARFYTDRINKNLDPNAESLWLALRIERKVGDRASEASYAAQLRRRFPNSPEYLRLQQGQFE